MTTHVVTKALPRGKTVLQPGTEVDASDWKWAKSLEEQRYIKPITVQPDGRDKAHGKEGRK